MAASYDMHDHGLGFIRILSRRLHHLSRARRRKIVRIHGMDRRHLLSDIGFACPPRLCYVASGDFDARSGFSSAVGSPSPNCALDHPDLALCFGHRRACLFNALQMVSAVKSCTRAVVVVSSEDMRLRGHD